MFDIKRYTSVIVGMVFKAVIKQLLMLILFNSHQLNAKPFSFALSADMRDCAGSGNFDNSQYFKGVCEAIVKAGAGAFMIIPGDVDPQQETVQWTIEQYIGKSYPWYLAVGNHEAETPADMKWLRGYNKNGNSLPSIVNSGPQGCKETTYSFDYENTHFVIINEYYDGQNDAGTDGDIVDALYEWLAADLAMTKKQHIFVIGHEPAFPQPDVDNGRERHVGDSLDEHPANRDRFWKLLSDRGVVAFICGHTHNHSAVNIDGVWQIDVGHARGKADTGAPSTFLIVQIAGDKRKDIKFIAYRDIHDGDYDYNDIIYSWDASLPVELANFSARVDQGEVILLRVLVHAGAPSHDLLELGHRSHFAVEDNEAAGLGVDTRGEQARGGDDDRILRFRVDEVPDLGAAVRVIAGDTHDVALVLLNQVRVFVGDSLPHPRSVFGIHTEDDGFLEAIAAFLQELGHLPGDTFGALVDDHITVEVLLIIHAIFDLVAVLVGFTLFRAVSLHIHVEVNLDHLIGGEKAVANALFQ